MLALLATLLLSAQAAGVRAQIPYLDPIPWVKTTAKIGQEAVLFNLDRFWDTRTDWTANRLGVTGLLRAGRSGMFYLRVWYVAFDSGDLPVLERWPDVRGPDAEPDWPGEARSVGLGRPQLGGAVPVDGEMRGIGDAPGRVAAPGVVRGGGDDGDEPILELPEQLFLVHEVV